MPAQCDVYRQVPLNYVARHDLAVALISDYPLQYAVPVRVPLVPRDSCVQQQLWSHPLMDTVALEQLPADQRHVSLHARQAERVMLDLRAQGQQAKVVDISE